MEKKGKLELAWTGKYLDSKLEPRILIEMENKSVYGDINQNMLIHGDFVGIKGVRNSICWNCEMHIY